MTTHTDPRPYPLSVHSVPAPCSLPGLNRTHRTSDSTPHVAISGSTGSAAVTPASIEVTGSTASVQVAHPIEPVEDCHPERSEGPAGASALPATPQSRKLRVSPRAPSLTTLQLTHLAYKSLLSPILCALSTTAGINTHCRFQPTCSDYATLAFAQHGPIRGLWLSTRRLLRCHPFTRGGWDPVPPLLDPPVPTSKPAPS